MVPDWLAEVVRAKRAPVPWPDMARAAVAICVPLAVTLAAGKGSIGSLPATGGLLGTVADNGGPYPTRVRRVASATIFGGAAGIALGSVIHGHGWVAVGVLVLVAVVSGTLSAGGDIGSMTGLQLLVYTSIGLGPLGAQRPVWHTAAGFAAGVAWALLLTVPGWLHSPHGKEVHDVAAVYDALAGKLAAIGSDAFTARRQAVTAALNTGYDEVLTARTRVAGRNRDMMRLVVLLNASQLVAEASTALGLARDRPPPLVIATLHRIAETIRTGGEAPFVPPAWDDSAGARALRDAVADAVRVLSGRWSPAPVAAATRKRPLPPLTLLERIGGGRIGHRFTLRLTACILSAGIVTEVLSLQRSYWVPLTVAVVFKPDYGSVLVRVLQRGLGTMVGAVLGAVLLITVHGLWLLFPFAVLAALLPFGRSRNYGLMTTFLTPLAVVLIELNYPGGWQLAEARLLDTLMGCGIVLAGGGGRRSGGRRRRRAAAGPDPDAAADLPGDRRPARRVPADDVRAARGEQAGVGLVARRGRARAGDGRDHRGIAGGQPGLSRAAAGRGTSGGYRAAQRLLGGGDRRGAAGSVGSGPAGGRRAQAGDRGGARAAGRARCR